MRPRVVLVGNGRLGGALARALTGYEVVGPLGRGEAAVGDAVLLCVPDSEIPGAAAALADAMELYRGSSSTALSAANSVVTANIPSSPSLTLYTSSAGTSNALNIPPPKGKVLYVKLRDDPGTVDTAVVPLLTPQP